MPALRLTVSALGDASLTAVFRPFVQEAARARAQVAALFKGAAQDVAKSTAEGAKAGAKAQADAAKVGADAARSVARTQAESIRTVQELRNKDHKQFLDEMKEQERAVKGGAAERAKARKASDGRSERIERVGSAALRTFGGYMSAGAGVGRDVASGFGVDLSIAGGIGRGMARNSAAIALSNAAYKEGGPRESVAGLEKQAMALGSKYAMDPSGVLGGLTQYQKLTGDLATGKAALEGLTALAGGTGTKLDDMLAAAGNVGNALGDGFKTPEEKAAHIMEVMKGAAAFGQEGAVEVSDLTTQLAKIAAASTFFEGDRSKNLLQGVALAQLARQSGGASSATQAATSVAAFANTLRTPARRREFEAMGVKLDSTTEKGQLRPMFDIIKDSIKATNGDLEKMKKLFANVLGDKGVNALLSAYNKAGGGAAGMDAIDKEIGRFSGTMTDKQIASNNAERLKGEEAQGIQFQIELDNVTSAMGKELAPAMKELAPVAMSAARALAGIITFTAKNPAEALTAAMALSIGQAGLGAAVKAALQTSIGQQAAAGIAVGVASFMITKAVIEYASDQINKGTEQRIADESLHANAQSGFLLAMGGKKDIATAKGELGADLMATERRAEAVKNLDSFGLGDVVGMALGPIGDLISSKTGASQYLDALNPFSDSTLKGVSQARDDKSDLASLQARIGELKDQIAALSKATLNVNVVGGLPSPAGPGVDNGARGGGVN